MDFGKKWLNSRFNQNFISFLWNQSRPPNASQSDHDIFVGTTDTLPLNGDNNHCHVKLIIICKPIDESSLEIFVHLFSGDRDSICRHFFEILLNACNLISHRLNSLPSSVLLLLSKTIRPILKHPKEYVILLHTWLSGAARRRLRSSIFCSACRDRYQTTKAVAAESVRTNSGHGIQLPSCRYVR